MNPIRNGNFTSSGIVALTSKDKSGKGLGAPAKTYVIEKNMERLLGRSIDDESNAKPLVWGRLLESRVFNLLGTDYSLTSQDTDQHPTIPYWVGSKDGVHYCSEGDAVLDFKCPISLKSFIGLVMPLYCGLSGMDAMLAMRNGFEYKGVDYPAHKDGDKYYWQLVSNAIINKLEYAELIVYMPYQSELDAIRTLADGEPGAYWIWTAADCELPYLPDNGTFKNINIIRFKVPDEDKVLLTECVERAGNLLINNTPSILIAQQVEPGLTIVEGGEI